MLSTNLNRTESNVSAVKRRVNNINIKSEKVVLTPDNLKTALPISEKSKLFVAESRDIIANIIRGADHRKLVVVGPCSIHDMQSAKEYALRLKALHDELIGELFIVMRVYFEKPRTTVGWKGMINDPHLNNSFDVETGLTKARELLLWLAELKIPVATEVLDPITPQYLSELVSWAAIGARTSESQTHREMASGLSMPIGYKNGTDGSASAAINAMQAAASSHCFMGINQNGQVTLFETNGNQYGHVILRGGTKPNYYPQDIANYETKLQEAGLAPKIMVDCSHGNSLKDYRRQPQVLDRVVEQIVDGSDSIIGFMLESHLNAGAQKIVQDRGLQYGVSVTDACIDWQTTANCLYDCAEQLTQAGTQLAALRNGITF